MDDTSVEAYLGRIGADRPRRPDLAALAALQERHLDTVPFGFRVTVLAARVFGEAGRLGPPFDHLVLRVHRPTAA